MFWTTREQDAELRQMIETLDKLIDIQKGQQEAIRKLDIIKAKIKKEAPKKVNPFKVIKGGLYKPPVKKVDDHLTDKFRAFLEKERIGEDQAST